MPFDQMDAARRVLRGEPVRSVLSEASSDKEEKFQVIVEFLSWDSTEDSYEKGEVGKRQTVMSDKTVGIFDSVDEVIKKVSDMTGVPVEEFFVFDGEPGRVSGNGLFDEENNYVGDDKNFLGRFKKGEVRAWSGEIDVFLQFAKTWTPSDDELVEASSLKKD